MEEVYQPPNSPNLNGLDLGFFRSIQTLQEQNYPRYIGDIVAGTLQAWREVDMMTLNANLLTLQCCMKEVIRVAGNNNYKVPHMKKAKLAAKGMVSDVDGVDSDTINDGFNLLCATDLDENVEELALEIFKAMELYEFSTQMEKLAVDEELDDDIDAHLANILSL
ncbi:hypothetical protein DYB32_005763 [Aphanomyces invadans]|uniref:Uncharacterized protein n=1 Tax=Aphanomyces invadans TaxID=157072 RepID=A0A3R7CZ68_9STRA|nr:hypothetical protein DYB32_005763 [Aphanomyces invadans]